MTAGARRRAVLLVALVAAGLPLTGCTAPVVSRSVSPSSTPSASSTPTPTPTVTPAPTVEDRAAALVASMTPDERAGAVLMTAGTATELPGLRDLVRRYHLGGVMVRGRSAAGTAAVARAFAPVRAEAPEGLPLLTATDQEGGLVQVLSGPGFSTIPSAVLQGQGSVAATRSDAERWGSQLKAAGVDLDLAPVADVPCAETLHDNPPVADLRRQYGSDPAEAGRHVAAFVAGMHAAGVDTTVKHFPGLGCVRANTDTTARVVDDLSTADTARLDAFRDGVRAGAGFVMMSSAQYARIDPDTPAVLSSRIVQGLLRTDLGFDGVVMTDDVGGAKALQGIPVGQRAVRFLRAGGDLVLDIVPGDAGPMHDALVRTAADDPAFDATLRAAATRVVAARLRLAD